MNKIIKKTIIQLLIISIIIGVIFLGKTLIADDDIERYYAAIIGFLVFMASTDLTRKLTK